MISLYALFCLWGGLVYGLSLMMSRREIQSPRFYLSAIFLVFLPFIAAAALLALPYHPAPNFAGDVIVVTSLNAAIEVAAASNIAPFLGGAFWAVYSAIAFILTLRIIKSLRRLSVLGPIKAGVITSGKITDPACLPWPRRAILLPAGLSGEARDYVLAHERAHQKYYDAEMTLTLCLLGAVFWLNYPLARLIKQWRFAIELRADAQVLHGAPRTHRKDYAALLLRHIAAQNGPHKNRHEGARPCPSMALIPDQKRRTEMRLKAILNVNGQNRKPRWAARIMVAGLCAAGLGGGIGLSALAADDAPSAANQNQAPPMKLVKRVPPVFPLNCISKESPPIVKTLPSGRGFHGWVKVSLEIDSEGVPFNVKAVESSKACFEANSIAAARQWRANPVTVEAGSVRTRRAEYLLGFIQTPD